MTTKTCKRKSWGTGNWLIFLKFPKSQAKNRSKNLQSSSPRSTVLGRSGRKEELENYASSDIKLQATSEFWSGQIKPISASWITMLSKRTFSASWNNLKPATTAGLGQLMTFLTKSQKPRNSALNLPPKKNMSALKHSSIRPSTSTTKFWRNMKKSQLRSSLKPRLRRLNEK